MKTAVLLAFLIFSVSGAYAEDATTSGTTTEHSKIASVNYVAGAKDAAVGEAVDKVYGKIPTSENGNTTNHALIWVE